MQLAHEVEKNVVLSFLLLLLFFPCVYDFLHKGMEFDSVRIFIYNKSLIDETRNITYASEILRKYKF